MNELHFLEEQQVNPLLIQEVEKFRAQYPVAEAVRNRVVKPAVPFTEKRFWKWRLQPFTGGKCTAIRLQGHGKEHSGGESGLDLWPSFLQYFV